MSDPVAHSSDDRGLAAENATLYRVIRLVSSSLELGPMLAGIVEIATEATACHACFIYLVDGDTVTIRAASPVFSEAVDAVSFSVEEGLTGWVVRHRRSAFLRDGLADDPRSNYVPLLREEDFQSMVAVPILSRGGEAIGVIVLHTRAPHEFGEDVLNLLEHIASLVSGAIENAQAYDRERRRVDVLTGIAALTEQVSGSVGTGALAATVTGGARALLGAGRCSLYRLTREGTAVELLARAPEDAAAPVARTPADLLMDPALLTIPLIAGEEPLGMLACAPAADREFRREEREIARAIAHLAAVALTRVALIEDLTTTNTVKDLFEALAAGNAEFAAAKAGELRCDLSRPYVIACATPAGGGDTSAADWSATAERVGLALAQRASRTAVEAGPGPVRALIVLDHPARERAEALLEDSRAVGAEHGVALGLSGVHHGAEELVRCHREAVDAATIGRALVGAGGAVGYGALGAYRYLVHIAPEDTPQDRMRDAVDLLIDYDRRRRTALLDTLERYLSERQSVIESARQLYVHPNTLRQRLARIEELTGLSLEHDDLLSLELAIKLARLHRRPLPAAG
ncbi:GAF domain-containing protein [Conexibacter sp. DBS9H8]|uniref:helix-turn-helix domain-containing protein n=1 Tax=Conexibacter sp. DBS9H8 TaxID=2937801 RepID=UPI00200CF6D7|nr:GAF domain-containing protein [Conexibacter sp. DBS9H8]